MKIVRFDGGKIGITDGTDVVEVAGVDKEWPPVAMLRFVRDFDRNKGEYDFDGGKKIKLSSVRLDAPIVWPNKIVAYPVNYLAHGDEMRSGNRANLNGFFLKANSSISGPNDPIVLPDAPGREIHHECELGLVIGRGGRHISRADALSHVFGYCCLIDATIRGSEERVMRKSYDSFCPIGPWLVTADEVPDPQNIRMRLWVNDELRQDANTKDMIVDIPGMIETASSVATLYPGDLFATGTPAGVGPIVRGDNIRIRIEHVGEMSIDVR